MSDTIRVNRGNKGRAHTDALRVAADCTGYATQLLRGAALRDSEAQTSAAIDAITEIEEALTLLRQIAGE